MKNTIVRLHMLSALTFGGFALLTWVMTRKDSREASSEAFDAMIWNLCFWPLCIVWSAACGCVTVVLAMTDLDAMKLYITNIVLAGAYVPLSINVIVALRAISRIRKNRGRAYPLPGARMYAKLRAKAGYSQA